MWKHPKTPKSSKSRLTRRLFLKHLAKGTFVAGGTLVVGKWADLLVLPGERKVVVWPKAVLVATKQLCSGCRTCEIVCAHFNTMGEDTASLARITVRKDYLEGDYEQKVCYQCSDPPCLAVCPVSALHVDEKSGTFARVIDEDRCIGCQRCLRACRKYFDPPRPRFDRRRRVSIKCHLCFGDPQCVKFCNYGALRLERSEKGLKTGYPFFVEV